MIQTLFYYVILEPECAVCKSLFAYLISNDFFVRAYLFLSLTRNVISLKKAKEKPSAFAVNLSFSVSYTDKSAITHRNETRMCYWKSTLLDSTFVNESQVEKRR